jgi:hypothetical protein
VVSRRNAARAVVTLQARASRGVSAAVKVPLDVDGPDVVKSALVAGVAFTALSKARALGRSAAPALISVPEEIVDIASANASTVLSADASVARASAERLARRWSKAVADARASGSLEEQAQIEGRAELTSAANLYAEHEALDALNNEVSRLSRVAHESGLDVVMTWSADLDKRTCEKCDELNGEERTLPDEFDDLPPLHPSCRCHVLSEVY